MQARMPKPAEAKDKRGRDRGEARRWPRRLKIPLRSHVPRLGRRTAMPSLSNGTESPLFEYANSNRAETLAFPSTLSNDVSSRYLRLSSGIHN
jgi:hypothetical protein